MSNSYSCAVWEDQGEEFSLDVDYKDYTMPGSSSITTLIATDGLLDRITNRK